MELDAVVKASYFFRASRDAGFFYARTKNRRGEPSRMTHKNWRMSEKEIIMPFKFLADGTIALDADKKHPIYINADGAEAPFDADTTVSTISRLNGEAKAHRIAKEAAEAALKPFKDAGIEDAGAAAEAIKLAKKEQVANATRAAEEKQRQLSDQNEKLTQDLNNHIIGGSFASSKFIADKLAIPADIAQKVFGDRFKVDGGKLVPMGPDGNPIFSATRHGEHADFEEALQMMVGQYANKDMILKGSGASGGGAQGGSGGAAGKKEMGRAQFFAMDPAGQSAAVKAGTVITD
jgi:hypothetical protein